MQIMKRKVGDIFCAGTGFGAAELLMDGTARSAFDCYLAAWRFRYNSPERFCYVDADTQVASEFFISATAELGTVVRVEAISAHRYVGAVEHRHRSLRNGIHRVMSPQPQADFDFVVLAVNASLNWF